MSALVDELRVKIRTLAERVSGDSMALGWELGRVYRDGLAASFGYPSFAKFLAGELDGHLSRTQCYDVTKVAVIFWSQRRVVDQALAERRVGLRRIMDLAKRVERGQMDLPAAVAVLEGQAPAMVSLPTLADDPEELVRMTFLVRHGDLPALRHGLTMAAIRGGHRTHEAAFQELVIGEGLNPMVPRGFEIWRESIEAGTFQCKLCGEIPTEPTGHHVLPQGLFHGAGPIVLLCWSPCHQIVQPKWRAYGDQWYGAAQMTAWIHAYQTTEAA